MTHPFLADIADRPRIVVRTTWPPSANWTDPGPPARQMACEADAPEEALRDLREFLAERGIAAPEPEYLVES